MFCVCGGGARCGYCNSCWSATRLMSFTCSHSLQRFPRSPPLFCSLSALSPFPKLHERHPPLIIALSSDAVKKHPRLRRNLVANQVRMATPYDSYNTIVGLLSYPHAPDAQSKWGRSLIEEPPVTPRSCKDARIKTAYCGNMVFNTELLPSGKVRAFVREPASV